MAFKSRTSTHWLPRVIWLPGETEDRSADEGEAHRRRNRRNKETDKDGACTIIQSFSKIQCRQHQPVYTYIMAEILKPKTAKQVMEKRTLRPPTEPVAAKKGSIDEHFHSVKTKQQNDIVFVRRNANKKPIGVCFFAVKANESKRAMDLAIAARDYDVAEEHKKTYDFSYQKGMEEIHMFKRSSWLVSHSAEREQYCVKKARPDLMVAKEWKGLGDIAQAYLDSIPQDDMDFFEPQGIHFLGHC